MADEPTNQTTDETPATYEVKLFQSHIARSNTEIFHVQAKTSEDALAQAEVIAKEKGLTKDYDFEVERQSQNLSDEFQASIQGTAPVEAPEAATPAAAAEAPDAPTAPDASNPVMASSTETTAATTTAEEAPAEAEPETTISNDSSDPSAPLKTDQ